MSHTLLYFTKVTIMWAPQSGTSAEGANHRVRALEARESWVRLGDLGERRDLTGHKNDANMTPQHKHTKNTKQIKFNINTASNMLGLLVPVHL